MARLGKQIPSPPSTPIARRLHAMASRDESSHTNYKWQRTDRRRKDKRPVAKVNYGIVGKIVLVVLVTCILLFVFLMLR